MQAAAWSSIRWSLILGAVVAWLSLTLAAASARQISGPIARLQGASARIAAGETVGIGPAPPEVAALGAALAEGARRHRAAEAQLAAIVTSSIDPILSKTLDGTVTSWNAAAERLFGYSSAEAVGQSIRRLLPPDRIAEEDLILARIGAGETVDRYETVRVTRDGRAVDVAITVSPIRDAQGSIAGASTIVRDITERKRTEQALAESEERLASALQAGRLGVHEYDPRTRQIKWDRTVRRLWGVSDNEAITYELFEAGIHPADRARVKAEVAKALDPQGTRHFACEYRVISRADNVVRWVLADGDATFEGNAPVRLVGTVQDITERKQAEFALSIAAERAEIAQQAAKAMNYEFLPVTGEVNRTSSVFEALTGYRHAQVPATGDSWRSIIHPDDVDRVWAAIENGIRGGQGFSLDYRIRHAAGHEVWLHDHASILQSRDGDPPRVVGMVLDITERKRAEEQVALLMREVNHRAKNMLGLVQAIARQTAAASPQDFVKRFSEHVQALSANQDLLVRNSWSGVEAHDLVLAQLSTFADLIGNRITIEGPPLHLSPGAAQSIGLALHELATNTVKHGALSGDNGRVRIEWRLVDDRLLFEWREEDGPAVVEPTRKGFGSTVLTMLAKGAVSGDVTLDYAPSGVVWRLSCPADQAIEARGGNREQISGQTWIVTS